MSGRSNLRPDIQRTLTQLESLPSGSVVLDPHGHAWQKGGATGDWYRAYDSDGESSWAVAQWVESVRVLKEGVA